MLQTLTPLRQPAPTALVAAAIVFPSLLTLAYFVLLAGHPLMQPIYVVGKVLQFAVPAVYVALVLRQRLPWVPRSTKGLISGAAFGMLVLAAGWLCYTLMLRGQPFFATIAEQARARVEGLGVDSKAGYTLLALFYCVVHSGLEEYYWRWFVFRQLHARLVPWSAVAISAAAFTAHHVIVLCTLLDGRIALTAIFSTCVLIGGLVWSLLYLRFGNLSGAWLSHALIDALIFLIGYDVMFG